MGRQAPIQLARAGVDKGGNWGAAGETVRTAIRLAGYANREDAHLLEAVEKVGTAIATAMW